VRRSALPSRTSRSAQTSFPPSLSSYHSPRLFPLLAFLPLSHPLQALRTISAALPFPRFGSCNRLSISLHLPECRRHTRSPPLPSPSQYFHHCIINLVIGTLYCSKNNFEFGITRVIKSLDPPSKKVRPPPFPSLVFPFPLPLSTRFFYWLCPDNQARRIPRASTSPSSSPLHHSLAFDFNWFTYPRQSHQRKWEH